MGLSSGVAGGAQVLARRVRGRDPAAAEEPFAIVKDASLTGRHALGRRGQLDLAGAIRLDTDGGRAAFIARSAA